MNKKILLITALFFLIIGISAVSAEDINQTDDTLGISDSDVISADQTGTYNDLYNDIKNLQGTKFDVQKDYKYNNKTDDLKDGIRYTLDETTFTIEGNNHVIDASNIAGVFKFINGTVYINNLKLINSGTSSIILDECVLYTNNVTFENNYDSGEGAAVFASHSNYYSTRDKFVNNYAKNGASVYGTNSIIKIDNSSFTNNKEIEWSLIYAFHSDTTVQNTVFENIISKYATAIYCEEVKLTVLNSKFINLNAKNTAGAIGVKKTSYVNINGCTFINTTSSKNGGAIFADLNGKRYNPKNVAVVENSTFDYCTSQFGGAYLQLGGQITIIDSELRNNVAEVSGGAIYLSNTTSLLKNLGINNNKAKSANGGAMYIDDNNIRVSYCDIINNTAGKSGSGIYLTSSGYEIKNTKFKENKEDIISFFDKGNSSLYDNYNDGKILVNQEQYTSVITYQGKKIILDKSITVNETAESSRFDLRDYNLAGVVKDQGSMSSCWAFGATGALESAFLKATGYLLDLSENNIQNSALKYGVYGSKFNYEEGYSDTAMSFFVSWLGTVSHNDDTYDELGKISLTTFTENSYHIQDSIVIPKRENVLDNDKLKDALIKYGGLTVTVHGATANNNYYNKNTHAQYVNGNASSNHIVTLVGWDDNYSKDNFLITPKGNGAWICKNSWGSDWGENGYFYVSYYDTTFAMTSDSVGYIIQNTEAYSSAYQYDIGEFNRFFKDNSSDDIRFTNTYTAVKNELISAVGTYFNITNEKYTITVYVDGKAVYTQSGASTHKGFETIKLNKKIAVNKGHKFSVEIQANTMPLIDNVKIHFQKGVSIAYYSDNTSEDLGAIQKAACIKVYTFTNKNPQKSKNKYYSKNSKIKVKSTANGKKISIAKKNKVLCSATVKDGEAEFDLTLEPGVYSIITTWDDSEDDDDSADDDVVELFEYITTIDIDESITIGYNAQPTIDAEFVDDDGVELFYTNITYTLDGKNYTGFIEDNDGILSINLPKLSIGTHTLILRNPETFEESETTIKVVSRFSGNSNVNMYYADGSKFKVRVFDDNGKPVAANEIVVVKLNKKTYNVKINSNGYAILTIPDTVKPTSYKYTLTAKYAGQTIKNTVVVKQTLKLTKVTVKKSAKKLVLKATLKKGKTPLKYKKVTFKFNGKTYIKKTDKNGIAKITIKQSVLKKLKVGKTINYQVTYLKNTVKKSVKVKK